MKKQIRDIATIRTGIFARSSEEGNVVYLQLKHFDEDGQLAMELYPDLLENEIPKKHLLQSGDILFAAKGSKNFATVYEKHNPIAVASTSFFVIKIKTSVILPHFLVWMLNQNSTLNYLKSKATGTSIPSISKQVLEDLKINIPSINTQKTILEIANLREEEKKIKMKIEELKDEWINARLRRVMSEEL